MHDDKPVEDALRRLLRDPRWALPPRPGALARIRVAARRMRLLAAAAGLGVSAVVAAAIVVPLIVLHTGPPALGWAKGVSPSVSASRSATPGPRYVLPPVGAPGFPAGIYPPPRSHRALNLVGICPNPSGLQPPGRSIRQTAIEVISQLGRGFGSDLRLTDRVLWPAIRSGWEPGGTPLFSLVHGSLGVLYSGPLDSYHQAFGPPDMSRTIRAGCGSLTAQDTWLVVTGPANSPGIQGELLLLTRRGHVLVWNAQ